MKRFWRWLRGSKPPVCKHEWQVKGFPLHGVTLCTCKVCKKTVLFLYGSIWEPSDPSAVLTMEGLL